MRHNLYVLLLALCFTAPANAFSPETPLADSAQEMRAKTLFHEIRCIVCQGETIADSPAGVAQDMRADIRAHITQGDSDEAIRDNLVSRYGDVVLMRPPLKRATTLLWFGPVLILAGGLLLMRRYFKGQPQ